MAGAEHDEAEAAPDPTQLEHAPHPRETPRLYGQDPAERGFLTAFATGRLHHAWLLTGPKGVGKATLAWRIARFLLSQPADAGGLFGAPEPPRTLDIDPANPVARRIRAGSEPGVFVLKRGLNDRGNALSQELRIDEVRRAKSFLQLSAAEGGRRVVIVDAADEMNVQASNALLKMLEEPPARAVFLLISHQPGRLLPTIRSRCRELRLTPLAPADLTLALQAALAPADRPDEAAAPMLAELAVGSVGEAVRLSAQGGLDVYAALVALAATLPRLNRPQAIALADSVARRGADTAERFDLIVGLTETLLARLARAGLQGPPAIEAAPDEAETLARLSPNAAAALKWAAVHQNLGARARQGKAVNLDPATLVMDMLLEMTAAAA